MQLKIGQLAPNFTLNDQKGASHSLTDYRGRWVVLYFYPKDETPGCTTEACAFRDAYHEILQSRTVVLGVSADQMTSHKKFAEKYALPFPLLADPERNTIHAYDAASLIGTRRVSYIIDPNGAIVKIYDKVQPANHAREVVGDLTVLKRAQRVPK
jgi:thioredoxin-dependent peroxiredoxin